MAHGPGISPFPSMVRGDTFRARDIATITLDGVPLPIISARMQVRKRGGGEVLLEWPACEITGASLNTVNLSIKTSDEMQALPVGHHEYDLEVVFQSDSAKLTVMAGLFPVTSDITRN